MSKRSIKIVKQIVTRLLFSFISYMSWENRVAVAKENLGESFSINVDAINVSLLNVIRPNAEICRVISEA